MQATLIDSMGTDLTVVNAARVSFGKQSEWDETCWRCDHVQAPGSDICLGCGADNHGRTIGDGIRLSSRDAKLISYLARHEHTSPFRHCFATFHVKAPVFVARQLGKHQVGMSWNEVSRRYVEDSPEFYWPEAWRKRSDDKKQGSSDETIALGVFEGETELAVTRLYTMYGALLSSGVAPEQARMILPQNTYTEWYWSGSLLAWAHMCNLRTKPDTQAETQIIARQIDEICATIWPESWKALRTKEGSDGASM